MIVSEASDQQSWDAFLAGQPFRPFLQSWTMGEVYRDTGQEPLRIEVRDADTVVAICQAILVPAKRGRHLSIPYGPIFRTNNQQPVTSNQELLDALTTELTRVAKDHHCSFIRMSPFWPIHLPYLSALPHLPHFPSPLHLLAEHLWYLPLEEPDPWQVCAPRPLAGEGAPSESEGRVRVARRTEEELLTNMRKTTRNLIRRAEKDGVTVEASADPNRDIETFIALHEETHKRHRFTPYTDDFFRAQVKRFAERGECTLYLARYQGEVAAASIHMHAFGETSYHHGASTHRLAKVPLSYLLQWTAIKDALRRSDHIYNFWGIAPTYSPESASQTEGAPPLSPAGGKGAARPIRTEDRYGRGDRGHPFAGVTLFKTGFGGALLPLVHCMDFPLSPRYHFTRAFERIRKWHRGF